MKKFALQVESGAMPHGDAVVKQRGECCVFNSHYQHTKCVKSKDSQKKCPKLLRYLYCRI